MVKVAKLNSRSRQRVISSDPIKLDIGCGGNKKAGFTGVDRIAFPGVDIVHDFNDPWPWEDGTVDEVHCSHCFEHFDATERMHFINELYRVLKPGAKCTLIAPHWSSCRAYGDPTHKWPPVSEFCFFYWKKEWRMANAPHTDASNLKGGFNCNFEVTWGYSLNPEVAQRNQEYQQYAMTYLKEACQDVIATLTAIKNG
jgi:SAM-dependent methyltransferase